MLIAIVDDIAEERILLRTRLENILDQKNVKFHRYEYELFRFLLYALVFVVLHAIDSICQQDLFFFLFYLFYLFYIIILC